jgi:hypothetical protein
MDHIGIDVHKTESQLCILGEDGQLSERRIRTTAERFAAVLGDLCTVPRWHPVSTRTGRALAEHGPHGGVARRPHDDESSELAGFDGWVSA